MSASNRHVAGLDLVRFACALLVVGYHLCFWFATAGADYGQPYPSNLKISAFAPGWAAVEVFFVLSGYVIAFSAEKATARKFILNRFLRLYPTAWICVAITLAAVIPCGFPHAPTFVKVARSLVILPIGPWLTPVFWTLPIELAFYGLVGVFLALGNGKRLGLLGAALGFYSTAFWGLVFLFPALRRFSDHYPAALLLLRHGCFFGFGVILWSASTCGMTFRKAAMLLVFGAAGLAEVSFRSASEGARIGFSFGTAPAILWALLTAALVLSVLLRTPNLPPRTERWITTAGLMTYPLYLLHGGIGSAIVSLPLGSPWLRVILALGVCLVAAFAVTKIEPAIRRRVRAAIMAIAEALKFKAVHVSRPRLNTPL